MASTEMTSPTAISSPDFIDWSVPSTPYTPARTDSVRTVSLIPNRHPDMPVPGSAATAAMDVPPVPAQSETGETAEDGRNRRRFGIVGPRPSPSSFIT
ncbi:hypothetical protein OBBRIDRAFT_796957 [Obba rivulosa]|uniref:Uncharacterized protein n=1 Tax=Obba rivulosa TaxID=1052685 RepID=A0A8E2DLB0_9APHY|nr:hypothetical protein OBBRIDRAFT_796957 [Obba rivulosa]